ncbi:MAG: hypothetical protein ACXW3Y_02135 [Rhodoplanes sp.]
MMRVAIGVMAVLFALAAFADADDKRARRVPVPAFKIEKGDACVASTEEMRRDHMNMLLHQRDRTMRQGLREPRFSLKNCVDCHASNETGSVVGKDGFCSSCHTYASVSIDCFECHTPMRQSGVAGASR